MLRLYSGNDKKEIKTFLYMTILAIETSCDDTCVAIVEAKKNKSGQVNFKVLSNIVSSQVKLHAKYGGVYPALAKREHQKNLPIIVKKALKEAGKNIDLISVTAGPGLEPCLWTGINFATDLSKKLKKPIIAINHIEAHILVNFINQNQILKIKSEIFPAICLVVSGGHTQLILMKDVGKYQILGETRDDAAGECFDKTARILGLGYPGGPIISRLADKQGIDQSPVSDELKIDLPRPMISQENYDFSFSGLKTAVLYDFKSRTDKTRKSKEYIQKMALEIQQAIIDVLIKKTLKAIRDYGAKSVILGGGVTANKELRKQLQQSLDNQKIKMNLLAPEQVLCTDNALMTAIAGFFQSLKRKKWKNIKANANLKIDEKI
ncbi:MAG: tRNA (adenosine(37)-N6)-threonylcarbamoyltransferase complex transferase subunit TsaD [Candidatus Nealsonbacteria bacterium]|nr:tRNA (adenosine(37)-N6)-threonylcarbamoyltransferase complex transferase subunit TsaD [Candidatus Nealsonbacteria bacterium]